MATRTNPHTIDQARPGDRARQEPAPRGAGRALRPRARRPRWARWSRRTRSSVVLDAGIHDGVEEVGDQVHATTTHGDEEARALDDRVVARPDRLVDPAADPGPREDRLRQDRSRQEGAHLQPHDRQHGQERVPERVTEHDRRLAQPLGLRRADVLPREHLEHARPHHPRDHGERDGRQRRRRQDQVPDGVAKHAPVAAAGCCPG